MQGQPIGSDGKVRVLPVSDGGRGVLRPEPRAVSAYFGSCCGGIYLHTERCAYAKGHALGRLAPHPDYSDTIEM
jgi:hypothetical protein